MALQADNKPEKITLREWQGVNQSSSRSMMDDQECWWLENLIPIAAGQLRAAWGPSVPIYTAPAGVSILRIFFTCIDGVNPLGFMFKSDGTVDQVNLLNSSVTGLGQIWQPVAPNWWADLKLWSPNQFGATAGQSGGVLIGSPQGYYAWDGENLTSPGQTPPSWLSGGATTDAAGNALVMPSGLPGIYAMEVYLSRMFVMGQTVISMSESTNGADFSASDGGGSWGYMGDQLTSSYTDLVSCAGVLLVFGDSMTSYVYNLQLVGSTTVIGTIYTAQFTFSNINPQIGHRYFRPVGIWLEAVIVFDGAGLFILAGQSYVWISEKLTNLVATVNSSNYQPTMTAATIFGQRWFLVNGQFTDPWGNSRNLILAWNGKIWTVLSQGLTLTNIGGYEQNSVITPYGTDGTSLYQLFAQPDPALRKRISTKAYTGPDILTIKDWKRTYVKLKDNMSPPGPEGVYLTGTYSAGEGGVPGGSQPVSFEIPPGTKDTRPHPTEGKGLLAWMDLESLSPDFTVEWITLTFDERSLFGA